MGNDSLSPDLIGVDFVRPSPQQDLPLLEKLKAKWAVFSQRLHLFFSRLESWSTQSRPVGTIAGMEINLEPAVRLLTAPIRLVGRLFGKRASSRRTRDSSSKERSKLRTVKLVRFLSVGAVLGAIAMIIGFFSLFAWYSRDLPKPGEVVRRDGFSTKLYDRNGELLYDLFGDQRRTPIKIADVPDSLKQATIAIEDKDFYKHQGFDILTIVRIPYNLIFRGRVVGGSTLTQQLVKKALLTDERSIERKFKELVLSMQIERTFTKDEILEMYLNEVPYGGNAAGVGTASEVYFNKNVSELSVVESAILAGLPQRPTAYSPYLGKTDEDGVPLWQTRTEGVLRRMKEDGYLTDLAYEQALSDLETVQFERGAVNIKAPHFVFYVRDQLEELYGEDVVENAGFKVTTSIDMELQETAQNIVMDEIDKVTSLNITNGASLVMEPDTGEIIAMIGSKDFNNVDINGQFNVVVDGLRQPGSSIKPVTYLALMQRGYTPASMLMDVKTDFVANEATDQVYSPNNYDGTFRGPVSIRNSLGSSLNVPAVKALALVGVGDFLDVAYNMGFVTLEPTQENMRRFGLAVTLGGAEVHMIDTVSAYSAFANGGTRIEPVSILKVEDKDGNIIYEHKPVQGPEVFTPEEGFLINSILSDDTARRMAFGANSQLNMGPGVSVKTGTTNDQRDNWAIGWSQEVIVGAWVGNSDNSQMTRVASGVSGATPIWRRIMQAALEKGYQAPAWEPPAGIEQVLVDAISGYPEHDGFPSRTEYVIKGTLPALPDPIHTKLKLCRGEDKLATDAKVAAGDFDEKEFIVVKVDDPVSQDGKNRWQLAIDEWINGQEDSRFKPPTEYCGDQNEVFVELKRPENEKSYPNENIQVEVVADASDGIEKIEIWANGSLRETINNREYKGTINLSAGRYEVYAKAFSRSGKSKESNKVRIGTGGVEWDEQEPSPIPTPTPNPTPSPSPSPSTSPLPIPTP